MTRRLALVAAVLALLGMGAAPGAPPVFANAQDRITVSANSRVTRQYPGIVGSNPVPKTHNDDLNVPPDPDPSACSSLPSCDEIPLTIPRPAGLTVRDTFTFRVELQWADSSDLDLYLWQEPPGPTTSRRAFGSGKPEVVIFPAGDARDYHLVVNNAAGVNQGYAITVIVTHVQGDDLSRFDVTTTVPPLDAAPPLVTLPGATTDTSVSTPTSVVGNDIIDPDLGNLSAAGPVPDIFGDSETQTVRRHRPVAGSVVVMWGVLAPLVLASGAGALLYRRRPRALSYRRD